MHADVARLDLRERRRLTLACAAGMAVYMLVVVALYPAFRDSTQLDELITGNPTVAALFGATGALTTPSGWMNANAYANFLPLIVFLLTIGYGSAALAGQSEAGTLGLVVALPKARGAILAQKIAAMAAQATVVVVVVALCTLAGRAFEVTITPWHLTTTSLALVLAGLDLGLVALATGAATGARGTAIGVASALAAAAYLISSLAAVVDWLHPFRVTSVLYWAVGDDQLAHGAGLGSFLVLGAVGVLAALAAHVAFLRMDVA